MFTENIYIGVLLAVVFIGFCLWMVIRQTKTLIAQDKVLFLLIFLVTLLSSIWSVDKIVAHRIELLTPEESKSIFEIIRNIVVLVLGYYFGTKKDKNETP